ncbi:MAG: hypothetical protein GY820_08940 [Gammaproteobacteria bacterium]|nr:hypothetical protein [Gammaproteobacteria bacterium]
MIATLVVIIQDYGQALHGLLLTDQMFNTYGRYSATKARLTLTATSAQFYIY